MGMGAGGLAAAASHVEGAAVPQERAFANYFALLKPRVMSLVVFTGGIGFVAAPGPAGLVPALLTLLFMAIGAGACGALNMWYDADIDAVMRRTQMRPIPSGKVRPGHALLIGIVLATLSVAGLGLAVNGLAAGLLAFTIGFYILVYTAGLKRRTPQNIVIGGAAGALPPMIGWAAASGTIGPGAVAFFLIIFLWTPPHFWALAIARAGDYAKAGVPMMPVVAGTARTATEILVYTALLTVSTFLPVALGTSSPVYGAIAAVLDAVFIWRAFALWRVRDNPDAAPSAAMKLFGYSIIYLFALFLALLIGAR